MSGDDKSSVLSGPVEPVGTVYVEVYVDASVALSSLVRDWDDERKRKLYTHDPEILDELRELALSSALKTPNNARLDVFSVSMRNASRGDG